MLRFYNSAHEDITNQPSQYCGSPACLGEPWCSAWGICKANLTMETPEEASFASEDDVYSPLFAALSQQLDSSSPTEPALPTFVECEPSHPISSSPPAKKRRLFAPIGQTRTLKRQGPVVSPKKHWKIQSTVWACSKPGQNTEIVRMGTILVQLKSSAWRNFNIGRVDLY